METPSMQAATSGLNGLETWMAGNKLQKQL